MREGAPYLYTPSTHHGSTFDFNPRAYSQATYAASLERQMPKPKRQGPLIDMNRHPDSWEVITSSQPTVEPMPANTRTKVLACRWIQFSNRLLQIAGALGLFVCVVTIKGTQDVQGWLMRIPPAYDFVLNLYAVYHLARDPVSRPAGSAASYNFFALCMDGGLIPFYIFTSMFSYSNYKQVPNTEGRWRTMFASDDATNTILYTAWLTGAAMAALHLASMVLDVLLLLWFRKISNMPPDMNPLDTGKKVSKHKHKNSEMTVSSISTEDKKLSQYSNDSRASLPNGYNIPDPSNRQVPFFRSRAESQVAFSPHTLDSARESRANLNSPQMYQQPGSARASQMSFHQSRPGSAITPSSVHSPYNGHSFPFPPGQDRGSFVGNQQNSRPNSRPDSRPTSRFDTRDRAKTMSPAPNAAPDPRAAKEAQSQSLLRNNWYVYDEGSDTGSPVRGNSPRPDSRGRSMTSPGPPPVPIKNQARHLGPYDTVDKENLSSIRRQLTVSSSVYSDDSGEARIETAKVRRYGDLGSPPQEGRWVNGGESRMIMGGGDANRVVSRSGVELSDGADPFDGARQRNVSGKNAEEGLAGWNRGR